MGRQSKQENANKYYINPKLCKYCSKPLSYDNRQHSFCSHRCAIKYKREFDNHLIENYSDNRIGIICKSGGSVDHYNRQEIESIIINEYIKNENTLKEIAYKHNISTSTIRIILQKNSVPKRQQIRRNKEISQDTRLKLSHAMKKCHAEGRHPGWTSVNSKKESSYPEIQFLQFIQECEHFSSFTIKEKFPIYRYVLDFVIVELKIDIEMDGQFHFFDKNTIQKDILRDEYMKSIGWRVFRVSWNKFKNNRKEIENELIDFINNCEKDIIKKYTIDDLLPKNKNKYGSREDYLNTVREEKRLGTYWYKAKRKFEIDKEVLEILIKQKPMTEIGRMFGVSDNAVKKRCKILGIELRDMRGYWNKLRANSKK